MNIKISHTYLLVGHIPPEGRSPNHPTTCFRKISGSWASVPRVGDLFDFGHYYGQDDITMTVYTPSGVELHFCANDDAWPMLAEDGFERTRESAGWRDFGVRYAG